jgi:hypothetical protein
MDERDIELKFAHAEIMALKYAIEVALKENMGANLRKFLTGAKEVVDEVSD